MYDPEIDRLRRLRATALRVRNVARALGMASAAQSYPDSFPDSLLNRGGCAAWRIARTVSGRLRGHPYSSFQKDAGIGVVVANSLAAANAVLGVKTRHQGLLRLEPYMRSLARELSDVRALTCAHDLNESFARSEIELRALLAALDHETGRRPVPETPGVATADPAAAEAEWPFLAL